MSLRRSIPPSGPAAAGPDASSVAAVRKMLRDARNEKEGGKANFVRRILTHPVRAVPVAFLMVILIGAALLMLPASRTDPEAGAFMDALFTSVSAVCVTGLITVDT